MLVRGYRLPVGERVLQISWTANSVGSVVSNAVLIPASGQESRTSVFSAQRRLGNLWLEEQVLANGTVVNILPCISAPNQYIACLKFTACSASVLAQ